MRILLVHRNFPGQFRYLAPKLVKTPEFDVVVLAERTCAVEIQRRQYPDIRYAFYERAGGELRRGDELTGILDDDIQRGELAVKAAEGLRHEGFEPDIVFVHPGWGEGLFLKHVFPAARHLHYLEFPFHDFGVDTDFDPEFPVSDAERRRRHLRNATQLLSLRHADYFVAPTKWQLSLYPNAFRERAQVIGDGIDTKWIASIRPTGLRLPDGITIMPGDELVTYVAHGLEPYRGFHVFMRALPDILSRRPHVRVIVAGTDRAYYANQLGPGESWRRVLEAELGQRLPMERVHFLGFLRYDACMAVLCMSTVHVYLTYPFAPSYSLFEALAAGCLVVGSATEPVKEVVRDGENGLLVDFFDRDGLVDRVVTVLADPGAYIQIRRCAQQEAQLRYDFERTTWPCYRRLFHDLTYS